MSESNARRGRLIAFEGGEGSGKSTQAPLLARDLGAVITREPGGTEIGDRIRSLLLDSDPAEVGPETELLLIAAARAEHVRAVVLPALRAGQDVVTDRFSGSSLAYQGFGRGLDLALVAAVSAVATGGLAPDLNILLEVPVDVTRERMGHSLDRIEQEGADFHDRVRDGFHQLAAGDPDHWVVVNGSGSREEVAVRVLTAARARLDALPRTP